MGLASDFNRLPMDVLGAAQAEIEHTGTNCRIGHLVDQDKSAQRPVIGIRFKYDRAVGCYFCNTDGIQFQRLGSQMLHIVHVNLKLRRLNGRGDLLRAEL